MQILHVLLKLYKPLTGLLRVSQEILVIALAEALLNTVRVGCVAALIQVVIRPESNHSIAVQISAVVVNLSASGRRLVQHERASAEVAQNLSERFKLEIRIRVSFRLAHGHRSATRVILALLRTPRLCSETLTVIVHNAIGDVLHLLDAQLLQDVFTRGAANFVTGTLHRPITAPPESRRDEGLKFDVILQRERARASRNRATSNRARGEWQIDDVKLTRAIRQFRAELGHLCSRSAHHLGTWHRGCRGTEEY